MMDGNTLFTASMWILPILFAVTLHEAAHGYVAWILGDPTAKMMGRVTLNPIRHVDPFGTVILPSLLLLSGAPFLLGWAKPVPVRFDQLRNPIRDMIWVALAGPGTNIALAVASALLLHLIDLFPAGVRDWLGGNLVNALMINVILAVFNMIPLPPLDGGRVMVGILPTPLAIRYARLERYGMFILIFLLFILPWIGSTIGVNLNILVWLVWTPAEFLFNTILTLTGHSLGAH